jgi:hypothetical protein
MTVLALDDGALLTVWERTEALARPWRELALLAAACHEPPERLARLPIGERDRLLLDLRVGMFGERFDCETACPSCGARLELSLDSSDLRVAPSPLDPPDLALPDHGCTVRFRAPDSEDIAACLARPADAVQVLLERCTVVTGSNGEVLDFAALPAVARDLMAARLAELDPQADVVLQLSCPECAQLWSGGYDPAAFLLCEIARYVERVVDEVHLIAHAYGWSEAAILSMESSRRQRYLARVLQ